MAKRDDIYKLAHQLVDRATAGRQSWESFLKSAAYTGNYAFPNQLLIWYQRPTATACANIKFWNERVGRWVRRGSRSIAVLDTKSSYNKLEYVFDISDTTEQNVKPEAMPWMVTEENREAVWRALRSEDGQMDLAELLMKRADRLFRENQENLLAELRLHREGSNLEWYEAEEQQDMFRRLLCQSAAYMAAIRLGIDIQELDTSSFDAVRNFDSREAGICLGTNLCRVEKPLLRQIGSVVKQIDSVAIVRENRHNEAEIEREVQSVKEADHGVYTQKRISDSESDHRQTVEATDRQVRQPAPGISEEKHTGDLRRDDNVGNPVSASAGDRPESSGASQQDDPKSVENIPGAESEDRSAGLDAAHEHPEAGGRGAGHGNGLSGVTGKSDNIEEAESEKKPSAFSVFPDKFRSVTVFGVPALVSKGRIDRSFIPDQLYCLFE